MAADHLEKGMGKAPWLHELLCKGTDHILTELGRGMGGLLGLHLEGPKKISLAAAAAFSRAQIISSPN